MIRAAVAADVPRLVEMGMRFLRESEYSSSLAANPEAVAEMLLRLIEHEDGAVFVCGNIPNGMIGMHVFVHPFSREWIASELFWWVEPEARGYGLKLLDRAEQWAGEQQAVRIHMIAPNERVARLYRARGYGKLEESFQKDLL